MKCLLFADCDGAFLQADWLRWGPPTPQKSSKLSCLLCHGTNLYTKLFSPSSQPKNQSFNSATSWNLSAAPTFCSAAITGACCRAKLATMYNHQVILCPSTPNHLTKWKDLVPEWSEIPSGIVPTKQLASGSFGSSGSATESACDGIRIWWKEVKINLIRFCEVLVVCRLRWCFSAGWLVALGSTYSSKVFKTFMSSLPWNKPLHKAIFTLIATSWNLSAAPAFCSAAITGACCRAKIATMYNHQVILCPSTPNHLTKWKDLVPEWSEIPSGIVPTKQLASGSFGSSGSATESACDGIRIWWKEVKINLIRFCEVLVVCRLRWCFSAGWLVALGSTYSSKVFKTFMSSLPWNKPLHKAIFTLIAAKKSIFQQCH